MWKFSSSLLGGGQDQQTPHSVQDIPTQSWYSPSVTSSFPGTSNQSTPGTLSTASMPFRDRTQSPVHMQPSPSEAAGIIACLKDKSVDELRKLLNDPDAYEAFFQSLEQVTTQIRVRDELRKETQQLARENLEKEPRIMELRNQCMIIRTTELATAQEKLKELERQKEETLRFYSPASLLQKLQDSMDMIDVESDALNKQLINGDIDVTSFVQKYKNLRTLYHKRALIHLSAKTSVMHSNDGSHN